MHDQREKAQRDYDWMLSSARKQGIEQGIERGREEGTIIGRFKRSNKFWEMPFRALSSYPVSP